MTVLDQIVERTRARLLVEAKPDRRAAEAMARVAHSVRVPRGVAARGNQRHRGNQIRIAVGRNDRRRSRRRVDRRASTRGRRGGALDRHRAGVLPRLARLDSAREGARRHCRSIMKDFIVEPSQIVRGVAAGADAVLLLASLLDATRIRDFVASARSVRLRCARRSARRGRAHARHRWRCAAHRRQQPRSPRFHVDLGTSERLVGADAARRDSRCRERHRDREDVDRLRAAGFNAFLVGESLLRQNDRAAAVRALVQR